MRARLVLALIVAALTGCAAKGDHLTPATMIQLARVQGQLEADLDKPCGKDPAPRWCAALTKASLMFDQIVASSAAGEAAQQQAFKEWLGILLGLARKAATGL